MNRHDAENAKEIVHADGTPSLLLGVLGAFAV